jgi:signal transduction histidine kinase
MLTEILLLVLLLVVAVLMVVDLARTGSEGQHGQADKPAYGAERAVIVPSRAPEAVAFPREPAGTTISAATVTPAAAAIPTAAAIPAGTPIPAAVPAADPARRPESIGSFAGGRQQPRAVSSPVQTTPVRGQQSGRVRTRLLLLVIIPTVAVTAVVFCVVRIADLLNSPMPGHDEAILSALTIGAVVILVAALWAVIVVARSVLQPLYGLRAAALEAAGDGLPYAVRRMSQANGGAVSSGLKPVDVDDSGEIGEIARAFDQIRNKMLRLTANEATVHGKLDEMFVNLSHRSQSLVERQIRLIENLARGEQDAERLASLSKLDHIASRMHRNSQNLLVLAGQDVSNGWTRPVTLVNVINAAVSEVEGYERVALDAQPDVAVRGPVAGDLAHLFAELTENATSFSAADMPVDISGRQLTTGGALVEIADRGIGMTENEMAYANWQLENPSAADINIAKWMGLFVVARLAARHGIRIRLRPGEHGGLTSLVWLPDEVLTHQGAAASPMLSDLGSARSAPVSSEAATDSGYAATRRMTAVARSAEFASARGNPQDAPAGQRLATDKGRRPGRAWSPGGMQPVSFAEQPAPPQAEQPVSFAGQPAPPQADQPVTPQTEQLITLQAGQPATRRPSGSGQPDATAEDVGVSATAAPTLGEETSPVEVIVPPAEDLARMGPPIYDEVESVWFRTGRQAPGSRGRVAAAESLWSSPADEGWRAAQTVDTPTSGGSTAAGLPRRQPNANLVPGSIPTTPPAAPNRSAAAVRDRLTGLQRGASEGRAAAVEAEDPEGNDES